MAHQGPLKIRRIGPDPFFVPPMEPAKVKGRRAKSRGLEHLEQKALFQWATLRSREVPELEHLFAIPNGGDRHPAVAAKLKAEGVKRGVPDCFLAVPVTPYPGLFIEMKAGTNRPSNEQRDWFARLQGVGFSIRVCYSWREAANAILDYLALGTDPARFTRFRV